ncbi:MAG: hypothetical protein ACOC7U_09425 [Spirochaetota bacterium]
MTANLINEGIAVNMQAEHSGCKGVDVLITQKQGYAARRRLSITR